MKKYQAARRRRCSRPRRRQTRPAATVDGADAEELGRRLWAGTLGQNHRLEGTIEFQDLDIDQLRVELTEERAVIALLRKRVEAVIAQFGSTPVTGILDMAETIVARSEKRLAMTLLQTRPKLSRH